MNQEPSQSIIKNGMNYVDTENDNMIEISSQAMISDPAQNMILYG